MHYAVKHYGMKFPTRISVELMFAGGALRIQFVAFLALCLALALPVIVSQPAYTQTEIVLHTFAGSPSDGGEPLGNLVLDASGNLYGTTFLGGTYDKGTAFVFPPGGNERIIHNFVGGAKASPAGGLIFDEKGQLYGSTYGKEFCKLGGCYGSVYKLTKAGAYHLLYRFSQTIVGSNPRGALVQDALGNLYGVTQYGGASGLGTVFEITPAGTETVLHSFAGGTDGAYPYAGLILDSQGNLYGTTSGSNGNSCGGTNSCGNIFKIGSSGTYAVLYRFAGGKDGAVPEAGLVMDGQGNLYGTTFLGGGSGCQSEGCGTVFELTAAGTELVLYRFAGGSDGLGPAANLIFDGRGNLYGTTVRGGDFDWGTVFELTPGGTETVLYSFSGGSDGGYPATGLIPDSQGKLYGTTEFGGSAAAPGGFGIVFQISQ